MLISLFSLLFPLCISQSPAPVCMFYFAHPFGISSTATTQSRLSMAQTAPGTGATSTRPTPTPFQGHFAGPWNCMTASSDHTIDSYAAIIDGGQCFDGHVTAYMPWPADTWRREHIWSPILGVWQQRQNGAYRTNAMN